MPLPRKQAKIVQQMIDDWQAGDVVDVATAERLRQSIQPIPFDWQRLAKYAMWGAIACIVIALGAVVADEALLVLFKLFFDAPDLVKCAALLGIAAGFFHWGLSRRRNKPDRIYTNEALFFLGVIMVAGAIGWFGKAMDSGSGHFSLLLLMAAVVYCMLGLLFPSVLVWVFGLLALGAWFGAETGYVSGWGAYYLGMNYPTRFVLFGLALLAGVWLMQRLPRLHAFTGSTKVMGYLYTFVAIWIMSIFGNYGDRYSWHNAGQLELFGYGVLFLSASAAAIWHGLKYDDSVSRGFGITFLFINLYTRFFEYFWEGTHKAIFFAILGVSLWWLGSHAEKVWQADVLRRLIAKAPAGE
ncbi:DUF2157 domain-containing protein [Chitinivorax sp. B]|uniref:DUF2157 domain-containing protein n=1 Tax=Chitinivorax sp. B TaxID=2502235 RepID=UPI0010F6BED4|nr:DUF2157 domain-containing protein [Chitinivorax sp. B]